MAWEIWWIWGIPLWSIWFVSRRDATWVRIQDKSTGHPGLPGGIRQAVGMYAVMGGLLTASVYHTLKRYGWEGSVNGNLLAVFAGCLLFACITDHMLRQVYHFIWWPAWGAGLGLAYAETYVALVSWEETETAVIIEAGARLVSLLLYILLQERFFCRMYGRADCHAFVACAMVECALGGGMREYLVHMAVTFGALTLIQLCRGNVNRRGNLKEPVALLPYLTLALCGILMMK